MEFEQTLLNFLMRHQEKYNRTFHFLILMDAIVTAAKRIELYYRTGALQGNLGMAGSTNVQGEEVMKMDDIAHEIVLHYLKSTERVIQVVSEEADDIIDLNKEDGRYYVYFDPLDGSSNVAHGLPVGFMFGIAKKNLDANIQGPEDYHLRAGNEYIAAGMFVIPTGMFTLALRDAGCWRFHMDETSSFVKPSKIELPSAEKKWELSFNAGNTETFSDNRFKNGSRTISQNMFSATWARWPVIFTACWPMAACSCIRRLLIILIRKKTGPRANCGSCMRPAL